MPGESKKISELESASSLNNGDLLELASVNALSETGYSSKKTTISDIADKVATLNPQAQADWTEADNTDPSYIQNKPTLATVATSGSYNDLQDQPQIPDAQVNSDWNSVSGVSEILNKPTLGTAASKNTGVANGVAELDANGLVPTSQLPAYVDDVLEYASQSAFPATGETGKIYVALDTNLTYRWGGSAYVEISPSLALGETSSTAYAGNKGKANADAISAIQTTLSGLATVATSGSYNDLTNQPNIPDSLSDLTDDVNISSPTDGQVLKYDNATSKWVNGTGGGGGASALDDLTDVTITNPTAGQVLKYDDINDEWVNGTGGGGSNSVELTYAEYQALTPEQQLDGTEYFITDINGDGQDFQPIIYSETEREIGVWIDGKPLYEKTVNTGVLPDTTTKNVAHGVSSIGTIIDIRGYAYDSNIGYIPLEFSNVSGLQYGTTIYANDTNIILSTTSNKSSFAESYITLRYTKTTDQAGSGTWTPQGVPAHHYSNNEQVVGTWVDGKTVYEKTVSFVTPSSNAYTSQNLDLLTADIDTIWLAEGYAIGANYIANVTGYTGSVSNDEFMGFIYKSSTDVTFDYRVGSSLQNGNAYLTIRYTKAST